MPLTISSHRPSFYREAVTVALPLPQPLERYAPEMELVKHAIDFSQRDVEGAVEVALYKVSCLPS